MKKSLIILPLAALLLIGCKGRGGNVTTSGGDTTSAAPTTVLPPSSGPAPVTSSAPRPASPWGAIPEGDGSEANPFNVTQAWDYAVNELTEKTPYDGVDEATVRSSQQYYVRGYLCYIEQFSDPTSPKADPNHPNSMKFYMADAGHYTTEEEVMNKECHEGFCVYFGDTDPALESQDAGRALVGKIVTVYGYILNWKYVPEITSGGVITNVQESL